MPLIRNANPHKLVKGDLILYSHIALDIGPNQEISPFCELCLANFRGMEDPKFNKDWGLDSEDRILNVRELGVFYYSSRETYSYLEEAQYVDCITLEVYIGMVAGKLNLNDPYEVCTYLRGAFKQCRPFLLPAMGRMFHNYISDQVL